jgi:hypothetical protein
MSEGKAK